jgi:CheY-like chemotaxis protein
MEGLQPFLQGIRILVVDDKADFRLLTAQFLARKGAQVFSAKNALEGLRLVREIHPEMVLSDIAMPSRTGIEFLADIRALGRVNGGSVPVVAMTGYVLDQTVTDAGFQGILRKPFRSDQLLAVISFLLFEKR